MSTRSKPLGIILIALYSGLFGLASFPLGCTAILLSGAPGVGALPSIVGFFVTVLGILLLASAYGLWTIQPWGRAFSWWLYAISIPLGALSILGLFPGQQASVGNTIFQLLGIAVDCLIIWYLGRTEAQYLFEQGGASNDYAEYSKREPQ